MFVPLSAVWLLTAVKGHLTHLRLPVKLLQRAEGDQCPDTVSHCEDYRTAQAFHQLEAGIFVFTPTSERVFRENPGFALPFKKSITGK